MKCYTQINPCPVSNNIINGSQITLKFNYETAYNKFLLNLMLFNVICFLSDVNEKK